METVCLSIPVTKATHKLASVLTSWLFIGTLFTPVFAARKPHIVFILADDLGWDDVSFHGSEQIPTPNLDKLAYSGVQLHNYYVQTVCSPSRAALMTGRYPIRYGLQHFVILPEVPSGLPLSEVTMANYLKRQGYSTHMVGKWHLGYFAKEYTPTFRGFDSHYGFYLGHQDYYTHNAHSEKYWGFDMHNDLEVDRAVFGDYSTELFTSKAEEIIRKHPPEKPLFLYFAHQAVHYANDNKMEAPYKYTSRFPYISDEKRRTYAGMVSALDESVGNITRVLKETGLYDNSVIIFSTDNGGPSQYCESFNTPLRGVKNTLWEGGIRGTGFVHSTLLEKPCRLFRGLMHMVDWLPTIYHVAGGNVTDLKNLDGLNLWDSISSDIPSPRTEVLHNIDPVYQNAALRVGDYKIIIGEKKVNWFTPPQLTKNSENITINSEGQSDPRADIVHCGPIPAIAYTNCDPHKKPCLYNVWDDPCEYYNLADKYPDVLRNLLHKVQQYNATAVSPWLPPPDKNANPQLRNNTWSPWITLSDITYGVDYR